jgi:putative spermidine/putrescine transport system permease protein
VFPALVTGIAILQLVALFKSHWTFTHLVIGHVVITLPYAVRTISAALIALSENTEDAARMLGANGPKTFFYVVLPQLKQAILIAATFCFILSFDNFPVTLWLADAENTPLPLLAYRYVQRFFDPSVAALSSVMIVISVAAIVILQRQFGIRRAAGF